MISRKEAKRPNYIRIQFSGPCLDTIGPDGTRRVQGQVRPPYQPRDLSPAPPPASIPVVGSFPPDPRPAVFVGPDGDPPERRTGAVGRRAAVLGDGGALSHRRQGHGAVLPVWQTTNMETIQRCRSQREQERFMARRCGCSARRSGVCRRGGEVEDRSAMRTS
jgi:hypothetical protein